MRTFFAFRHMGSVEWVTDQVPWSHSRGGDFHSAAWGREYFRGLRRRIGLFTLAPSEGMVGGGISALSGVIEEEETVAGSLILNLEIPADSVAATLGIGSAIAFV